MTFDEATAATIAKLAVENTRLRAALDSSAGVFKEMQDRIQMLEGKVVGYEDQVAAADYAASGQEEQ